MALPRRAFYSLNEVTARWDCAMADIAGWAAVGYFDIVTGIRRALCGSRAFAGFVSVSVADILPMFRRQGTALSTGRLQNIRGAGETDWRFITEPEEGIEVTIADLMIRGEDVYRFEEDCDLLRRPTVNIGASSTYDWEAALSAEILRIHEHGVPGTQAEWIGRIQEWFAMKTESGDVPDERTIRRRLNPIWKSLRASA
ncbi:MULTISPECIES: hypothetical protein [Roseobacteraceae]|uniref:Uncharacterized protein n=1 Tax=Tropicimonas aquimaris TaxID=914152 RepID=A0ABW3IKI4_9RHOB|nr:hypothetical protein [Aliiruegeria sabulilitoris]NDR56633.1 hypothetical protein [Pseudoruegeria sp. M32A2M]